MKSGNTKPVFMSFSWPWMRGDAELPEQVFVCGTLHLGCMEKVATVGPPFWGGPVPGTQGGHTREIARDRARLLLVTRSSSMLVSLLLARYYKQKVGNLDRVISLRLLLNTSHY